MKKKALYINELDFQKIKNGGSNSEATHFKALCSLYDVTKVDIFADESRSKIKRLFDYAVSPVPIFYTKKQTKLIKEAIRKTDAEIVFLENSNLGYFAEIAKKQGKKVAVFFHNCEIEFAKSCRSKMWLPSVFKNEKKSLMWADYAFVLSERDERDITKHYHDIQAKIIRLPATMADELSTEDETQLKAEYRKNHVVFVGSFFKANIEAVSFINEKLAHLCPNAIFDIWGFGMEQLKMDFKPNVINHGTAKTTHDCFVNADLMLFPIFSGSGMKIKTVESLMYGKYIVGSEEAFSGYPIQGLDCFVCNEASDYAKTINELINQGPRFSEKNRKAWLDGFTINKTIEILRNSVVG